MWRFSAGSVRRAPDAGRTADAITADLVTCSATALPQPLAYLVADTARGRGRVRIAPRPVSSTATNPRSWPNSPPTAHCPSSVCGSSPRRSWSAAAHPRRLSRRSVLRVTPRSPRPPGERSASKGTSRSRPPLPSRPRAGTFGGQAPGPQRPAPRTCRRCPPTPTRPALPRRLVPPARSGTRLHSLPRPKRDARVGGGFSGRTSRGRPESPG
ncbi:helicase-associated domain-containing protein [Streptomyces sp. LUP30]|uniref:helicase-associated domain-containing protein n=1 Tax=Streptomyces sp. LUP30 TaxID=1890285 RepID=UPI003522A4FA